MKDKTKLTPLIVFLTMCCGERYQKIGKNKQMCKEKFRKDCLKIKKKSVVNAHNCLEKRLQMQNVESYELKPEIA